MGWAKYYEDNMDICIDRWERSSATDEKIIMRTEPETSGYQGNKKESVSMPCAKQVA